MDKVRENDGLTLRQGDAGFLRGFLTAEHIGHISGERAHGLHAFGVLAHFVGGSAMYLIPVLGRDDGHLKNAEVFVDLIPCGRCAGAARGDDPGGGLQIKHINAAVLADEEGAAQEGSQETIGSGPVHGRTEEEAVKISGHAEKLVDLVIEHAFFQGAAPAAVNAPCDGLRSHPVHLGSDAFFLQSFAHFIECGECAAMLVRTSVDEKNLHFQPSLLS